MRKYNLNNGDLSFDLDKIKSFDAPITVSKSFDSNLDNKYAINIEDTSYWYSEETDRDRDFEDLKLLLTEFTFI
jgi:hypothetical protein